MIFEWESTEERLNRFMKIAPQKKMEWLRQMLEFVEKYSSKDTIKLKRKLKEYNLFMQNDQPYPG